MELIRPGTRIDFISYRKYAYIFSGIIIGIGLISIFLWRGLNFGIDFSGGLELQVAFSTHVKTEDLRKDLDSIGFRDARIQSVGGNIQGQGSEYLIRLLKIANNPKESELAKIQNNLFSVYGKNKVDIRRAEVVGSEVSKDLKQKGFLACLYACIGLLCFIWFRFELSFAIGAILSLVHDLALTVGIFSLTGKEISLTVIAALLTLIGYSLNDTIVVFDRIRENMKKHAGTSYNLAELMSDSISQTLSRTILTSLTVFIVVLCLYLVGGEVINGFAFAMLIGVITGTYSSIYIAAPFVLLVHKEKK
jgi:preprotein translocase subunit SecF